MVGGEEFTNGLAPWSCMAVEDQEEYLSYSCPPEEQEMSDPYQAHQCWEEKTLQHLAIKISGDFISLGEMKAAGNLGILLNSSHTDSLFFNHSPWVV